MQITTICKLIAHTIPKQFQEIAYQIAQLDDQTALELISKYNNDIKMSQKQLSDEIRKQTIRRCNV